MKNKQQMDQFCEEKGFIGWFETSAKENLNIDKACRFLVQHILENDISAAKEDDKDMVRPSDQPGKPAEKECAC